jgi:RNA polymerase sigma factor (sigma-70 family)
MLCFPGIFLLPMLVDRVCQLDQPGSVFGEFQHISRREKLDAVLRGIAKGPQQPRRHQGRNVMRLAIEHPTGLLRVEADGQLSKQRQKPMLIVFHTLHQSRPMPETEQTIFPKSFAAEERRTLAFRPPMEDLIKLVRTYRLTKGLAERLRLAEEIFRLIEPDLRLFVFSAVRPPAADDVFQEVLKAVAISLPKFEGNTPAQFWAWCYRIVRYKLADHYRGKRIEADRMTTMPPQEIRKLVDASTHAAPLSAADRHDLEYALNLLSSSKPECREYLWRHFVLGLDYAEIAEEENLSYDSARMRITRCLDEAKSLVA